MSFCGGGGGGTGSVPRIRCHSVCVCGGGGGQPYLQHRYYKAESCGYDFRCHKHTFLRKSAWLQPCRTTHAYMHHKLICYIHVWSPSLQHNTFPLVGEKT